MPKEPARVASVSLAELISDPVVKALMKADNVTEQELTELFRMVESKLKTTQMDADATAHIPHALANYRPGVGIMLLNRNNPGLCWPPAQTKGRGVANAARWN